MLQDRFTIQDSVLEEINRFLGDPANRSSPICCASSRSTARRTRSTQKRPKREISRPCFSVSQTWILPTSRIWNGSCGNGTGDLHRHRRVSQEGARRFRPGDVSSTRVAPLRLEISALQYFPWLIEEARQAIDKRELMPGRFIRVRKMKEQERDDGDITAVHAAARIMGASLVETLDTKGTDGSNVHLGGPTRLPAISAESDNPTDTR
jgi:hypothetical protein